MNMIRRSLIASLACAAMMFSASSVRADIWGKSTFSGNTSVSLTGNITKNTTAGTFTTYLASDSSGTGATAYISYCVDLKHNTDPTTYKQLDPNQPSQLPLTNAFYPGSTNLVNPNAAWDQAGFGRAAWLVNTFGSTVTDNAGRAALQMAVWKAEYSGSGDTATDYSTLNLGSQKVTSVNATATQLALANSFLAASVLAGGGSTYATASALWVNFKNVTGDHVQFQVIGVPEPSSLAIAGLGVLGFLGYGLKRRKSS